MGRFFKTFSSIGGEGSNDFAPNRCGFQWPGIIMLTLSGYNYVKFLFYVRKFSLKKKNTIFYWKFLIRLNIFDNHSLWLFVYRGSISSSTKFIFFHSCSFSHMVLKKQLKEFLQPILMMILSFLSDASFVLDFFV